MELTYTGNWTYDGSSGASVLVIGPFEAFAWEDGEWRVRFDGRHVHRDLTGKRATDLEGAKAAAENAIREHSRGGAR